MLPKAEMLKSLKPLQFLTHSLCEYLETTAVSDSPHGEVQKVLKTTAVSNSHQHLNM
jgi:hypothetical protein